MKGLYEFEGGRSDEEISGAKRRRVLIHRDDIDVAVEEGITENDTANTTWIAIGGLYMRVMEREWCEKAHRN